MIKHFHRWMLHTDWWSGWNRYNKVSAFLLFTFLIVMFTWGLLG